MTFLAKINNKLTFLLFIFFMNDINTFVLGENSFQIDNSIIPEKISENAISLRESSLLDNLSVEIVESLTTEVGPRRMGTEGDQRAIAWALEKFKQLGYDRFWTEEVILDRGWERGETSAEILSPYPHNIVMTALGYSVGTNGDLIGEVIEFKNIYVYCIIYSCRSC